MDPDVPYLVSVGNLTKILDAIQRAGVPEVFNRDFLKDLGFKASQDRPMVKVLKYLGMLDTSGKPQGPYRDFVDHTKAREVLAGRLRAAFDDLFLSDKQANQRSAESLRGWFKSKTGVGDSAAQKMASTFRALAQYADFSAADREQPDVLEAQKPVPLSPPETDLPLGHGERRKADHSADSRHTEVGFVYRIEIHLPDTQNVETFRAIFKAIREELIS